MSSGISEESKMDLQDNNEAFYTEAVVAEVTESPRVDGCLHWDDKVIAFRGRTPRARSAESCCGADIVQAYAAPYPKWMISKVWGAHRKNRKVSRVLQIAVIPVLFFSFTST